MQATWSDQQVDRCSPEESTLVHPFISINVDPGSTANIADGIAGTGVTIEIKKMNSDNDVSTDEEDIAFLSIPECSRRSSIEITVKENQNTVKLDNVMDAVSESSRGSTPMKRSHSVRERSRHESSDAEFEGIYIDQRRGSMTINCSSGTKGQRAHLPESLLNCSHHPNSVCPSESKEKLSCCHSEDKLKYTCDKDKATTDIKAKTSEVYTAKHQDKLSDRPSCDVENTPEENPIDVEGTIK